MPLNPDDLQLYRKNGRRYEAVGTLIDPDVFHNGTWLLRVEPGRRTLIALLDMDQERVNLLAAIEELRADLVDAIVEASRVDQPDGKMTLQEFEDWKTYRDARSDKGYTITRPSAQQIADTTIRKLRERLSCEKKLNNTD